MTDTLTITGDYAYANGMESGWVPWLIKQKTSAYEALFLVGGKYLLWLVGCLGFEPRLAIWVKIQALRWGLQPWGWECGPCPVFASNYDLAFTLQLRRLRHRLVLPRYLYSGFPPSLQLNPVLLPQIISRPLPDTSFLGHYLLIIQLFRDTECERVTAFSDTLQVSKQIVWQLEHVESA